MTPEMQMEQFSLAYIRAVASQSGYRIGSADPDWDGVDGTLLADWGRRPRIEFQAKATGQDILRDDHVSFRLDIDNYNDLRIEQTRVPRILIVLRMPRDMNRWLSQSDDELCQRYCAYWISLEGRPAVPNTSNITIHIPLGNVFNGDHLHALMNKVDRGETL